MSEVYHCTCGWIGDKWRLHKNEALWQYAGEWKVCEYGVKRTNTADHAAGQVAGETETTSETTISVEG